jgi:hypothetical protein
LRLRGPADPSWSHGEGVGLALRATVAATDAMLLPDIDFATIRLHRGTQADAFEELCCQLAGDEILDSARTGFDRKGRGGDGGVECFATLSDGTEVGWQVKYYWDMASALKSLDGSLTKALDKHPDMTRFIACLPIDLADSRKADVITALERWTSWKTDRVTKAAKDGRKIEIDRWDAFELKKRLMGSEPTAAGRVAYWFDQTLLTPAWLLAAFERTRVSLGRRYSPESHVDLPIRRVIQATTLDPRLFAELAAFSRGLTNGVAATKASNAATAACQEAGQALEEAAGNRDDPAPISTLRKQVDAANVAVQAWLRSLRDKSKGKKPSAEEEAFSNLSSVLAVARRDLREDHWNYLETRALLVGGEAGHGKSHLLADVCRDAITKDRAAIMVLGGKLPDGEPWEEILKDLGLSGSLETKTFLGALNTAGQAAGVRTILAIDALNEKNGQSIWPERLAGLVHDVSQFEWISLVLSCRSTYEKMVISDELDEATLPRVNHEGFTISEARRYLKKRGIGLAEEPNPAEEFETPLFLRICCDALAADGKAMLAANLGGVTGIFRLYTEAVVDRVNKEIGAPPQRRYVERAIAALAKDMADQGCEELRYSRAETLISTIAPPSLKAKEDLLFQLQDEGLLTLQPAWSDEDEEEVQFTFQRMGDHAIAASLLERSITGGDVTSAWTGATPLLAALAQPSSAIVPGLMDALAVQLPERHGVELNDVPNLPNSWFVRDAFERSLLTRDSKHLTDRTWQLIDDLGGEPMRFEILIAVSTDPGRDHNAEFLDNMLRALPMPYRDAVWSTHLAQISVQAPRLIEWVRQAQQQGIQDERAKLAGVQLCWFFTTSNRTIRDTATKALVALLAERPALARVLWSQFKDLDDAYLTERLVGSIYGAALQGNWSHKELFDVADDLRRDLFVSAAIAPNILTREHGRGVVRFADVRGALPADFDRAAVEPPYVSPWPIEFVTDTQIKSYQRSYSDSYRSTDEIVSSAVSDGDFARYIIDYSIDDWSASLRGTSPLPTAEEMAAQWLEKFRAIATPAMLAAHEALSARMLAAAGLDYAAQREAAKAAKKAFCEAVGEEVFVRWCAEAEPWRWEGMFQPPPHRKGSPAQFSLAWARRWVCKRAHDLGWSEALHGDFDRQARGGGRHEHSIERIGKKYQWLALYELCARMADNLAPLPDHDHPESLDRLRNIDPSLLAASTSDDGWSDFEEEDFWVPPAPRLDVVSLEEALAWLNSDQDYSDGADNIEVTDPEEDRRWLVLTGFETWGGGRKVMERQTWRRVACLVVKKADFDKAKALMSNFHFQGNDDIPSARSGGYRAYLGEHPWAWRIEDEGEDEPDEWIPDWRPRGVPLRRKAVAIRPTTASYLAEASGYDASISQSINLNLPASWMMDAMGLRLSDGLSIKYVDEGGVVRFMDPSVSRLGRSAALVDREAFLTLLEREGYVAIWALSGEKNIYGDGLGGGFGGRWTYTRLFHTDGSYLTALDRYKTFEGPSKEQLAKLRKAMAEPDDDNDD